MSKPNTKRPNFIFFITDQQRADHLGAYGNPIVQTPHIDTLAQRGLAFDNFYVASPVCQPNRATIMTGRMPSTNGVRRNGLPIPLESVTFVDLLRSAGYHTGLIGKGHLQNISGMPVGPTDLFEHLYEKPAGDPPPDELSNARRVLMDGPEYQIEKSPLWRENPDRVVTGPYYGFDHLRLSNGHSDWCEGHYTRWALDRCPDRYSLIGPPNALPADRPAGPQIWRTAMPEEISTSNYVAEETIQYLDAHAGSGGDDPFFLMCSYPDPHHPFTPPGKYWDMYDPADIPLPPSWNHVGKNETAYMTQLREDYAKGEVRDDMFAPFIASEEDVRDMTAKNYGMITGVDDSVGRILTHLAELGMDQDTVVIFTSDHGDYMGDQGLMMKEGPHFEGVLRVPFIWTDPDQADETGRRTDLLAGSIDIASTILARAGLAPYEGIEGFDCVTAARENKALPRDGLLIEEEALSGHLMGRPAFRIWSFLAEGWKLSLYFGDENGGLFDLNTDPHELNNLWADPTARDKKAELHEAMMRERMRLTETITTSGLLA